MKYFKFGMIFFEELFYALSIGFVILCILEIAKRGMVSSYINLSYLLLAWLVNGIILLVLNKNKEEG